MVKNKKKERKKEKTMLEKLRKENRIMITDEKRQHI